MDREIKTLEVQDKRRKPRKNVAVPSNLQVSQNNRTIRTYERFLKNFIILLLSAYILYSVRARHNIATSQMPICTTCQHAHAHAQHVHVHVYM